MTQTASFIAPVPLEHHCVCDDGDIPALLRARAMFSTLGVRANQHLANYEQAIYSTASNVLCVSEKPYGGGSWQWHSSVDKRLSFLVPLQDGELSLTNAGAMTTVRQISAVAAGLAISADTLCKLAWVFHSKNNGKLAALYSELFHCARDLALDHFGSEYYGGSNPTDINSILRFLD